MKLKGTVLSGRKARIEYCLENPQKEKKISFVILITHHFFNSFQMILILSLLFDDYSCKPTFIFACHKFLQESGESRHELFHQETDI